TRRSRSPRHAVRRPRADRAHGPRERAAPGGDVLPDEPTARRGLPVRRRGAADVRAGGPGPVGVVRGAGPPAPQRAPVARAGAAPRAAGPPAPRDHAPPGPHHPGLPPAAPHAGRPAAARPGPTELTDRRDRRPERPAP